jgi:hypothetical protein
MTDENCPNDPPIPWPSKGALGLKNAAPRQGEADHLNALRNQSGRGEYDIGLYFSQCLGIHPLIEVSSRPFPNELNGFTNIEAPSSRIRRPFRRNVSDSNWC